MTHKLDLPTGGWAEMKDSTEITRGEKKAAENARVRASAAAASNPLANLGENPEQGAYILIQSMTDEDLQPYEEFQNLMVRICLVAWSGGKLPVEGSDFEAMSAEDYEDLVLEARAILFKEPLEFGPDGVRDPKAPTANSDGSKPPSADTPVPSATTTPTPP